MTTFIVTLIFSFLFLGLCLSFYFSVKFMNELDVQIDNFRKEEKKLAKKMKALHNNTIVEHKEPIKSDVNSLKASIKKKH